MSHTESHWMRPIKAGKPKGRHMLIYIREQTDGGVATPAERRIWRADVKAGGWTMRCVDSYHTTDRLDSLLGQCCTVKGESTIWLLRGWTDLVLSGLAELMDAGIITWRYCNIGGDRLLIRGQWRGRKITITSLGAWTGGRWDNWGTVSRDEEVQRLMSPIAVADNIGVDDRETDERQAVETLAAIVGTCGLLMLPRVPPTAASAGMLVWRAWLGPHVTVQAEARRKKKGAREANAVMYVAPLPYRPAVARDAERHVVYALTNRQLRSGSVEGPLYCVDVRAAYLLGLMSTPIPVTYHRSLGKATNDQAAEAMCEHTGLGLVRINTTEAYYPCRLNGRVVPCRGRYWTWLAGVELAQAYFAGHVEETWALHTWYGIGIGPHKQQLCLGLTAQLDCESASARKKCWRAVYSSLIGRFAGWKKAWSDSTAAAGFGRWATWLQADPRTGGVVPYRAVAGKVQMLRSKDDDSAAVPLLFGCVTAQVRMCVQYLVSVCGADNVVNIYADSLWITQAGWQALQRRTSELGFPADNLRVKAIYDHAWMTGKAVSVVERDGARKLILPGVADGAAIDYTGHVVMDHTDNWSGIGEPRAASGVRRRKVRYSVDRIVERYSTPASVIPPGETVDIPLLDDALLQPLRGNRSIDDA